MIGEIQKSITRIEVHNVPLESTPFNQRKDNIAYKIITTYWGIEKVITHVSSVLGENMEDSWVRLNKANKIQI